MSTLIHLADKLNAAIRMLVIALFALCLAVILLQVACRSVLHVSVAWTEELARYLVVYIVYFAASLAARDNKLTRLEVLTSALNLSDNGKRFFDRLAAIFSILFWLIALWCVYHTMGITKRQLSAAMKIPMFIPYLGIFIGSILLAINTFIAMFAPPVDVAADDAIEGGID